MAAGGATTVMVAVLIVMAGAANVPHTTPHTTESAVTCQLVVSSLTPCASYLIRGGPVPKSCCNGVQSLYKDAKTTNDRQTACRCLEQAATLVPGINVDNAVNLPAKCDVSIPYKISPVFNCSTVQ